MHKLLENIENELHSFGEKGISRENVSLIGQLVDMYKDLKTVESMGFAEEAYTEMTDMPKRTVERREGAKFDRNINELYDKYLWCKKEYARDHSEVHKEKVVKALDALMSEICDLLFDINRDADFSTERTVFIEGKKKMEKIA
ncbi:MAG: hypothetical protein HDR01_05680 [Lachnospiraceae bacterium]|nr:hypothetical protein [Lachnospiraceae bacterium]